LINFDDFYISYIWNLEGAFGEVIIARLIILLNTLCCLEMAA